MRVVTNAGAVAALALDPAVAAASMRAALAGAEGAKRRARVDTGAMRNSIHAEPLPLGGARWGSDIEYMAYNEFGTSRMSAQPMIRPSVVDALAAL